MGRSRLPELMLLLCVVAVAMGFFLKQDEAGPPVPAVSPRLSTAPVEIGQPVPAFTLKHPDGSSFTFEQGPLLVVLTATPCGECLQRIDQADLRLYQAAREAGLPSANLLVYAGESVGQSFLDEHSPAADMVLCDPSADISVQMLGGSDATCWLLIDRQGKLAWRGPADGNRIGELLAAL
ncbi:MAG: TlpA family protein disulfide reductase [Vulcanimicrobiota bacterium]